VDGTTYQLQAPFMVIATQNPVEMEGTYPLPEAQRDRFTARISLGYPSAAAEREMLSTHGATSPLDELRPVAHAADVQELVDHGAEVVVLSRGMELMLQTSPETLDLLRRLSVEVHVAETKDAVELYNRLAASRAAGCLIHSTC